MRAAGNCIFVTAVKQITANLLQKRDSRQRKIQNFKNLSKPHINNNNMLFFVGVSGKQNQRSSENIYKRDLSHCFIKRQACEILGAKMFVYIYKQTSIFKSSICLRTKPSVVIRTMSNKTKESIPPDGYIRKCYKYPSTI